MENVAIATLPLHDGKAPSYLVERMKRMSSAIATIMVQEYGTRVLLERLADPLWFQALGSALGYDWHSSGITTVLTGVLREVLSISSHGVMVLGGKGDMMKLILDEIDVMADAGIIKDSKANELKRASRLAARVDTSAVQAGYQLYHQAIFIDEKSNWTLIQQGMNPEDRTARRYHWIETSRFVNNPPEVVIGLKKDVVLNMVDPKSDGARKASIELVQEKTERLMAVLESSKRTTLDIFASCGNKGLARLPKEVEFPKKVNWKAVKSMYENPPATYEELLLVPGAGPATVRALSLLSQLIYGEEPSWRDPIKFSFAVGGKDGVPYPVDRKTYDAAIRELEEVAKQARLDDPDKRWMLRRLASLSSYNEKREL
ncbi:MAG: DUF763 domain-containing protein [Thermoprotei archaeon]|nr:DUF763 domain-containing protein [TACK group archaeon]